MSSSGSQGRVCDVAAQLRTRVEYDRELGVLGYPRAEPRAGCA